jgi:hypothetical protein
MTIYYHMSDIRKTYGYDGRYDGDSDFYVTFLQESLLAKFNKSLAPSRNLTGVARGACFNLYSNQCGFLTGGYGADNANCTDGHSRGDYYKQWNDTGLQCQYDYENNGCDWIIGYNYDYDGPTVSVGRVKACSCLHFFPEFNQCAPDFEYPWFSELLSAGYGWPRVNPFDKPVTPWHNPPDSLTRRMFRLPVVDLSQLTCTPSPFINAGHSQNPAALRASISSAGFITPCNDIMTQVILFISLNVRLFPHIPPLSLLKILQC